ncbi:MAG: cyclic nucleotide-binding domain-containing protein [Saprospiraceae bacterium]|nr:cyclic nucleotide-binding domain-containing protein [Saprospiraceae bacterium]
MHTILQNRWFQAGWNFLLSLITLFLALFIPYNLVLQRPEGLFYLLFTVSITVIFGLDVWLGIYYHQQEHNPLYASRKDRLPYYLRSGFWLDVLAAIPFDLFAPPIWRVARLLKIGKISMIMDRWRLRRLNWANELSLLYMVLGMLIFTHWISCGWLVIHQPSINSSSFEQYIDALYWSITTVTTVGYGDITPNNLTEKIYSIFTMIIGLGFYGVLIGNIARLLSQKDPARAHYLDNIEKLSVIVKYRSLPYPLQQRIFEYYTYKWQKRLGFDENAFLEGLPHSLKKEVAFHLKNNLLQRIPIFEHASQIFIEAVSFHLQPIVFTPGDFIFKKGEYGAEMYFIINGKVRVMDPEKETPIAQLSNGDFFGEIALFRHKARNATIIAETYCDLYQLSKGAFDLVAQQYPAFAKQIEKIIMQREEEMGDV